VPDDFYFRNASCALILISTLFQKRFVRTNFDIYVVPETRRAHYFWYLRCSRNASCALILISTLFQKRVVRTNFDIYVVILYCSCYVLLIELDIIVFIAIFMVLRWFRNQIVIFWCFSVVVRYVISYRSNVNVSHIYRYRWNNTYSKSLFYTILYCLFWVFFFISEWVIIV
jgi:hypothetical protein